MEEIWMDTDYDYIEVSNYGRVRTKTKFRQCLFYDRHNHIFKPTMKRIFSHLMKIQHNNKGYCFVCYKQSGVRKNLLVHRLVATAFIPNTENKPEVNHIDGNPNNNAMSNLEWVTSSENRKHAYWQLNRPCFGKYHK